MKTIFSILEIILPTMLAGLFSFYIAKYTYNKNRPLDKLEIAYNRIYYPIYNLLRDENSNADIDMIIEKSKFYLEKYTKYADKSTLTLFRQLCQSKTDHYNKTAYHNYIYNIYKKNTYLRIRLGYLEPNYIEIYSYLTKSEQSTIRIFIEFCGFYILFCFYNISSFIIRKYIYDGILILLIIIIFEAILKFINFLIRKIRTAKKQPIQKLKPKD